MERCHRSSAIIEPIHCRKIFEGKVLGITGSNGKTIVKEWIWQLLRDNLSISRSPGSYNSRLGVPLSLCMLSEDSRLGLEARVSSSGRNAKVAKHDSARLGFIDAYWPGS